MNRGTTLVAKAFMFRGDPAGGTPCGRTQPIRGPPARLKALREVHAVGIQSCITLTPLLQVRDAEVFRVQQQRLPQLGEGRQGFSPPF